MSAAVEKKDDVLRSDIVEAEENSTGVRQEPITDNKSHLSYDEKNDDVAAKFLAGIAARPDAAELLAPHDAAEEKRLVRKIDPIVLTLCFFAFMMGSVDKVAIGSAAVMRLREDLNLQGQEYALTSAAIYFGAIAAIFPSLIIMQRVPANYYIAVNVMMWGIITCLMALCRNYADLFGMRVLLGIFESVISVAFGIVISMWFTRKEQPVRTAIMFSTASSIMNGILATAAVSYTGGAIAQWKLLFIMVGGITFLWSLLLFAFLPPNPMGAWWLTTRQRVIATRRMAGNHTGVENKTFKLYQLWEALYDPKTWLVFLINVVLNIPNGGLVTFNSIIVNSLGFSVRDTVLLGIPTGVFSWISSLIFSWVAIKTHQRCFSAMASCIIPFLGVILLYTIPRTNVGGSLVSLYLVYFYWGPYVVIMASVYANSGGFTKKYIVYAIAYIGYSVGNITFRAEQAPKYVGGVVAMLVCYCAAFFLILVYRFYLVYLNRKKERELAAYLERVGTEETLLEEWHDQTDYENPRFRYEI